MPFVLLFLALFFIVIGARGHASDASGLLAKEFTGPNSFIQWFLAIAILGVLGFYKPVRPFTDGFIGLVILTIFLRKGTGFFAQLENAFQNSPAIASKSVAPVTAPNGGQATANPTQPGVGMGPGNFGQPGAESGGWNPFDGWSFNNPFAPSSNSGEGISLQPLSDPSSFGDTSTVLV